MEPGSDLSPPGPSLLLCSDNLGAEGHSRWEIAPIAQQRAQSQRSEEDAEKTRQNQGNFQNNCASVYQGFLLFCSESTQSPRPRMRDCNSGSKPFVLAALGVSLDI